MSHWPILPILLPLFAGALLLILPSHERLKRTLSLLATLALLPLSLYLLQLADHAGVDVASAVENKLRKNALKHPVPGGT